MPMFGRMIHQWFSVLAIAGAVIFVSWSVPSIQSGVPAEVYPASLDSKVSSAPTAPSQSTVVNAVSDPPQISMTKTDNVPEQSATSSTSNASDWVDPNMFFPPGRGQELARDNCPTCHQFITFAYVRKTRDGWMRNRANHADRLPELSGDQIGVIYEYLAATLNHDLPIPKIPMSWVCSS